MNKFLEQYPALWVPKVGDRVRIIKLVDNGHYQIGDVGVIYGVSGDLNLIAYAYYIKFDNHIIDKRYSWVLKNEMELIGHE
jgi:hypothetical protein